MIGPRWLLRNLGKWRPCSVAGKRDVEYRLKGSSQTPTPVQQSRSKSSEGGHRQKRPASSPSYASTRCSGRQTILLPLGEEKGGGGGVVTIGGVGARLLGTKHQAPQELQPTFEKEKKQKGGGGGGCPTAKGLHFTGREKWGGVQKNAIEKFSACILKGDPKKGKTLGKGWERRN